jgi:hypothetical protein
MVASEPYFKAFLMSGWSEILTQYKTMPLEISSKLSAWSNYQIKNYIW